MLVRDLWQRAWRRSQEHDLGIAGSILASIIAVGVTLAIADEVQPVGSDDDSEQNPPPELSPLRAAELAMPTSNPEPSVEPDRPPFWGHNQSLGGEQ